MSTPPLPPVPAAPPVPAGPPGTTPEGATRAATAGPAWFRRVTYHSLQASLCPLIPVPFLDDWALGWVKKRAVDELLRRANLPAEPWQVAILAGEAKPLLRKGCLVAAAIGIAVKLAVYVLKRLFRKLVFFLTIKDSVDRFSTTFHEHYLLEQARSRGLLDPARLGSREHLERLRWAIDRAAEEVDPRPFNQLVRRGFRGSRRLLLEAASRLGRFLRPQKKGEATAADNPEALARDEERLLGSLTDRLMADLWNEKGYRAELVAAFDRALAAAQLEP